MRLILDLQGFKDEKNKFIPKELATYDGVKISHHIFKQPFPLNSLSPEQHKEAVWLMKNYHCINWNDGFTPLHHFSAIIQKVTQDAEFVYVKGREKTNYIKKYCSKPVVEIDEQPCLHKVIPKCMFHNNSLAMCALSNVFEMYNIFFMNK